MKISYLMKRVLKMNYKQMFDKIHSIHKKTGKSRLAIFNDMRECAVKYGAGYMDYDLYEMYNLTDEQRDTYLTRGRNNQLMIDLDDKDYWHFFDNKEEFYQVYDAYLGRSWKHLKEDNRQEIMDWVALHPDFIAKPSNESCGHGVEKLHLRDFSSLEACVDYLYHQQKGVVEEILVQDERVASLHPDSINTIRVVSILNKGKVHIVYTGIRIGNYHKSVDNFNNDGMTSPVDEKTGIILHAAIDKKKNLYEVHPITGVAIKGFQIPYWQEMLSMIDECARIIPQMAYVGWDVAMSEHGPVLIEGNNFPGHDLYQLPVHTPDRIGMYPKFKKAME